MSGEYRLPRAVADRLETMLQGRKNAPAVMNLARFLARFWSSPRRLLCAFPIDRRALAEHEALGLTEARVRGALAVLVEVGFLARYEPDSGKRYQRTEGGLQRRAILHRFGDEFGVEFTRANARAQAKRGAPAPARRPAMVENFHLSAPARHPVEMPSRGAFANLGNSQVHEPRLNLTAGQVSNLGITKFPRSSNVPEGHTSRSQLAQKHPTGGSRVIMGEDHIRPVPDSPLEVALARWAKAIGG